MKDHSISVDQARYYTSNISKYLDTAIGKASKKCYKTTSPSNMRFTKADISTSDEKVDKLTIEFNIHCKYCICSLVYLLSSRVD